METESDLFYYFHLYKFSVTGLTRVQFSSKISFYPVSMLMLVTLFYNLDLLPN